MRIVLRTLEPLLVGVVLFTLFTAGCGADNGSGRDAAGNVRVVAAFYPFAEAARQAGGAQVDVTDLTPAGAEPHDLEITTKQVDQIASAAVVLVMGHGFQPSVEDAAKNNDATTIVLDRLPVDAGGRDVESGLDPHVWLDPVLMQKIVDVAARALGEADPANASGYERNAQAYNAKLTALDTAYQRGLETCDRRTIFTAHAAFGWLAKRYDLEQESIAGVSPDAEPTPDRVAELADDARRSGATTIFTEPLVPPEIAQTLAREAGDLQTAALDPLEALTEDQVNARDDYVSVMRSNLATLRTALGCE